MPSRRRPGAESAASAATAATTVKTSTVHRRAGSQPPLRPSTHQLQTPVTRISIVNPARPNVRTYDPGNPEADAQGFVTYPNVDVSSEMTDLMGAARSYQVNATVAQSAKQQALDALDLGKA